MNETIQIEKEFLFKNNIKDITSISIDCDYKKNNQEVYGDFIISGEYKLHEISLNKEKFSYKIPFKYEIKNDIEVDSVNVDISNFVYDYNKDELMVNIEYIINGDRKDVLSFEDDESLEEFLNSKEVEIVDTRQIEEAKDEECDQIDINNEVKENNIKEEVVLEEILDSSNLERVETENIISGINNFDDKYITYKIYTIKENDTLENIVKNCNTTIDSIKDYNDVSNLSINDKIIIINE